MKNFNLKTTIASAALAAVMAAGTGVSANEVKPISAVDEPHIMLVNSDVNLYINSLPASTNAKEFDGKMMLPLRSVCEALGMNIGWDAESRTITIEKLPIYITCTPDADGYTFAKTAPQLLGSAPILENGTTYVPMNFATEILGAKLVEENGEISITTEAEEAPASDVNEAVLTSVGESKITLYDIKFGEVVANIVEDTVITDKDGNAIALADIAEGTLLEVKYANFMTMSLPPITNALEIKVVSQEQFEVMNETVVSTEAREGYTAVTVGDKENPTMQTVLNYPSDKKVVNVDGTDAEHTALAEGTKIIALASTNSTRSIPAQRSAYFIRIAE